MPRKLRHAIRGSAMLRLDGIVRKAVIPAAGFGTRMWPLTGGAPKEMLPVDGKPMIHHIVQEAIDAAIEHIGIVIRAGKESIARYFERSQPDCEITFVHQPEPRGLGDALLCARPFVGDECFAMLIPTSFSAASALQSRS
ncbi:MAG TPA: sugar phosphate nucleotidyltransferase [Xanthobacteraceae bacterium]